MINLLLNLYKYIVNFNDPKTKHTNLTNANRTLTIKS